MTSSPCPPAICSQRAAGRLDGAGLADELPVEVEHRVAPDDHAVEPGPAVDLGGHAPGDRTGLGQRERRDLLGRGRVTELGEQRVLVDVGDQHERLDARRAQHGTTGGGSGGENQAHGARPYGGEAACRAP